VLCKKILCRGAFFIAAMHITQREQRSAVAATTHRVFGYGIAGRNVGGFDDDLFRLTAEQHMDVRCDGEE
jgi:hypothetical protein